MGCFTNKLVATALCSSLLVMNVQASELSTMFQSLLSNTSSTGTTQKEEVVPQVIINAQLEPYVSKVLTGSDNVCTKPLADNDFKQMQYDQFVVSSFLPLYKIDSSTSTSNEANLYMGILIQKIRAQIEVVNNQDKSFLAKLSQSDFNVSNFSSTNDAIARLQALTVAHQSLELGSYTVDGFVKLAIAEYLKCLQKAGACNKTDALWSKWIKNNTSLGLYSPLTNSDMATKGASTVKENFSISLPVNGSYSSPSLVKALFETLNIYGGEKFDYFKYLEDQNAEVTDGPAGEHINAPGKVVGGLMLKLAAQRLVAYYKYQKCRLLAQNAGNVTALASQLNSLVSNSSKAIPAAQKSQVAATGSGGSSASQLVACPNNVCPDSSLQVTSGNNALAIQEVAPVAGLHCQDQRDLYNGSALVKSCPRSPNGGISCSEVNGVPKCADEGFVFINGVLKNWEGNTGACYASSECDEGFECKGLSGSMLCVARTEYKVLSDGRQVKTTYNKLTKTYDNEEFVGCAPGYFQEGNSCVSSQRSCSINNGLGKQNYNGKTWGECQFAGCPSGLVQIEGTCQAPTRECTPSNLYPGEYPRGSDVATGTQGYNGNGGGWSVCEVQCRDGYMKMTQHGSFNLGDRVTSSAIDYCSKFEQTINLRVGHVGSSVQVELAGGNNLSMCNVTVKTESGQIFSAPPQEVVTSSSSIDHHQMGSISLSIGVGTSSTGEVIAECSGRWNNVVKTYRANYTQN